MDGSEHQAFVVDFVYLFHLHLLWSQNYLIPLLIKMPASVFVKKKELNIQCFSLVFIFLTHWFYTQFSLQFSFFSFRCLLCIFPQNAKIVSEKALRYTLYYNSEMSLWRACNFELTCLSRIMLHEEWRSDQIYHIKLAGSIENAIALSGFQMKLFVKWMQN